MATDGTPMELAGYDGVVVVNQRYLELVKTPLPEPDATNDTALEKVNTADIPARLRETLSANIALQLHTRNSFDSQTWAPFSVYRPHSNKGFPAVSSDGGPRITVMRNPLMLIVKNPGQTLSQNALQAVSSQGALMFSDQQQLQSLLDTYGLTRQASAIERAADRGLVLLQYQTRTLYFQVLAALVLLVALGYSSWLAASTYAINQMRRIFPLRVGGLTWLQVLRGRLIWELAFASGLTIVAVTAMAAARVPLAIWWTLAVPLGYAVVTVILHIREARRTFAQAIARRK